MPVRKRTALGWAAGVRIVAQMENSDGVGYFLCLRHTLIIHSIFYFNCGTAFPLA